MALRVSTVLCWLSADVCGNNDDVIHSRPKADEGKNVQIVSYKGRGWTERVREREGERKNGCSWV